MKDFSKLSSLLDTIIPSEGDRPIGGVTQAELDRRWPRCAGRAADASFPLLFISGRLVIFTESAIWATELRHQRHALQTALADLGMTRMEVRAIPRLRPGRRQTVRTPQLSESGSRNLASSAEGINDPALQAAVRRIAQHGAGKSPQSSEE